LTDGNALPDETLGQGIFLPHPKGVAAMFRRIALISLILLSLSVPCGAYDPRSVVIRLERGPCYGSCPVYGVTLYGDGTVNYAAAPKQLVAATTPGLSAAEGKGAADAAVVSDSTIGLETERRKIVIRRAVATSLRDEGYALQQKGQLRDAVIRYRQSLVWWPDAGLESYVVPLERKAGFTASQYRSETQQGATLQAGSGKAVKKAGMVMATIRNRSTLDVTILTRGESADAGTLVRAGEILLRPVQLEPNGEVTFLAVRNSQTLVSKTWYGNAASENVVPTLLYDDNLQDRLFVMTGLK
jgi:hypothetical protein